MREEPIPADATWDATGGAVVDALLDGVMNPKPLVLGVEFDELSIPDAWFTKPNPEGVEAGVIGTS